MKFKNLLNLFLLAVLVALAAVALFEPGKEEAKPVKLTQLDFKSLDRIELSNKQDIVFEKRGGHWRLTTPFEAPANEIRVRQLLEVAHAESEAHYPLTAEDLPKFELDKPKAVLKAGGAQLSFGGSEPIDMRRYVRVGEVLHLVNDDFFHHLNAPAVDYVDKKLLPEDAAPRELLLPGLKLSRGENGQWLLEPPGDAGAAADLASAWQTARAIEVKRIEQAPGGERVRVGLNDGRSIEFVIVQRDPDLLLARVDWKLQYLLPGEFAKSLLSLQKPETGKDGKVDENDGSAPEEELDELEQDNAVE